MKNFICWAFTITMVMHATAQSPEKFACYYTPNLSGDYLCSEIKALSYQDNIDAKEILKTLLEPVGLKPNFILQPCDSIKNCIATIGENGWRFILYDRVFLKSLAAEGENYWPSMSIFAHEVLHHLDQHTHVRNASIEKKRQMELEADAWSGRILAMLGASLDEAQSAIKTLDYFYDENFSTHPSKEQRLDAIAMGYEAGLGRQKKPREIIQLEDMAMQHHLYIKLDSLAEINRQADSGWAIKDILNMNNSWYGFFADDTGRQKNTIYAYKSPEEINSALKENRYTIQRLQPGNGIFAVLADTSKKQNFQSLARYTKFDANELNIKKAMGRMVKDVIYANGNWWVLEQDAEKEKIDDQIILTTSSYPRAEISQLWKKLYIATTAKFVNGQWITVMHKFKKSEQARIQVQGNKSTFPLDEFIKFEKQGFILESASFDGTNWGYTMNKFKNFKYEDARQ